jgi:hypothetical protein
MVKYLNYLQEKDKMIREFKFFHGVTIESEGIQGLIRSLRARWNVEMDEDLNTRHTIDAQLELTRILSEEITREVDETIIRQITTNWNGGQRA